nr:MAG TPA: hypothetical protein [Caudoviricetes sp.]
MENSTARNKHQARNIESWLHNSAIPNNTRGSIADGEFNSTKQTPGQEY